jgi:hypothetical protein
MGEPVNLMSVSVWTTLSRTFIGWSDGAGLADKRVNPAPQKL